jgi:methylase of polypeptide subunit release factors
MTRPELQSLLQSPYDRARWLAALPSFLPATQVFAQAQPLDVAAEAVASAVQLARIPLAGDRSVAVLEVRVTGQVDLQRNRVGLRNLVARFIGSPSADAVLAFFVGDSSAHSDYRFSFAARTNAFTADGQLEQNETAPRRYTYLFGPNQPCRTALDRFDLLRSLGARAQLPDLIEAFKVEPLFKEFYRDYGRVFDAVENHVRPTLPGKEPLRLFTQRLFNRLMFLAFVERKGWLRLGQRTDYLAALWNDYTAKRRTSPAAANFYADRLTPLFFEGLNQADRAPGSVDPRFGSVPYLNGGLFEFAEDGTDRLPALRVPDEALALILDPESGLFSRYNFTVAESTPLEIQVAVDPEMLGKVFEELVTGRHEQGSYYTPKPIVSFMGRAALVEYLADKCPAEPRATLEKFVHEEDASALRDPEAIHRALVEVKVCDLACGSGAYLLGMLHELLDLRTRLFASRQKADAPSAYERRLQIIERNLYGVDKDAFAVNIARLRLWLALVVEFEGATPPPLPNLDFKIEVGDALSAPAPSTLLGETSALRDQVIVQFRSTKAKYLRAHGEEKQRLKQEAERLRSDLKVWLHSDAPADAFDWALEFAEVFLPNVAASTLSGALNLGFELAAPTEAGGFDIIVANPPYVRNEKILPIKPRLKKLFPNYYAGAADLYVYFYARAHELLRPNGTAAFISSNKWLRVGYGEQLRQNLLDKFDVRTVVDFGELPVFESAATDPAIFLWSKKPRLNNGTDWIRVDSLSDCYAAGLRAYCETRKIVVSSDNFTAKGSRLATAAESLLQQKMEKSGPRLKEVYEGLLGWGIKTGNNDAFWLTEKQRAELVAEHDGAKDVILPMIVGDDVRRYEITNRKRYVIFAGRSFSIESYPSIKKHLLPFKTKLEPRPAYWDDTKNGEWSGRKAGSYQWFQLQDATEYHEKFLSPKIVFPQTGKECRFCRDESGIYIDQTVYFISTGDWFLLALLNSSSSWAYLTGKCVALGDSLNAGRLRFLKQYLELLPIPSASPVDRELVGKLAQQAQTLHTQRRARSEQFIRALGLDPADSTSRNPLEQPWSLAADDYAKRARKLHGRAPDLKLYEAARDETAALTEQIAKVEAEIDARVAALYGLDAEDQRWAAQSAPADGKQTVFFDVLGKLKARRAHFSLTEVQAAVNDAELSLADDTLKVYLSEATRQGLIHDAGRGWYSRLAEPLKLDPHPVQKLIRATKKALPLLDFCAWSTAQLNPWMLHLLAQPVAFLYVPRDTLDSVGETLREQGWEVAVNPGKHAVARDVRPGEKMVVLRPAHSKQPVSHDHHAAPEQVLVDLLVETEALGLMDNAEARAVLVAATDGGTVKMADLKRLAEAKYLKWQEIWPIN